jgi:hypothetical protein
VFFPGNRSNHCALFLFERTCYKTFDCFHQIEPAACLQLPFETAIAIVERMYSDKPQMNNRRLIDHFAPQRRQEVSQSGLVLPVAEVQGIATSNQ